MGTENVQLGVCSIQFDGINLGLTKGGVEVEVSTDTHKVMVDQYGESEVNELIMKRSVKCRAPLAETTLENLVRTMPGATLVDTGTNQVYTIDEPLPVNSTLYTVTIDGNDFAYTSDADATEAEITAALADLINASSICAMSADGSGASLVLTAKVSGVTSTVTVSGGTLAGVETVAAVQGVKRVDVSNAVGIELLSSAKKLVLHPTDLPGDDKSKDFIIYKAATAGALSFSYKVDEERLFNIEFTGYPDASNKLFSVGDPTAV